MNKQEFLEKYDNSKAYGWVAYTVSSCGYHGWTTVYSVGMTREEAEEKAVRDHGQEYRELGAGNIRKALRYAKVSEAAYRKLKRAKTLDCFHEEEKDGETVLCYDED